MQLYCTDSHLVNLFYEQINLSRSFEFDARWLASQQLGLLDLTLSSHRVYLPTCNYAHMQANTSRGSKRDNWTAAAMALTADCTPKSGTETARPG